MKTVAITILLFVVLFVVLVSGVSAGDQLVAKQEVKLINSWNEASLIKTVSCVLTKGESVEVIDVSTLNLGSSDKETIIYVRSNERDCQGWGFPDQFKRQ